MGLTSALYSTLTGLSANQQRLDVIGNNISNVNTIGYKSSRLDFETLFSQTVSNGSPPTDDNGGTNPFQIGLGTKQAGITKNFNDGSREITGVNTELAIEGDGFFILQGQAQVFSRDGTFKLSSENTLVNANGMRVQGYGIDNDFNIVQGPLQDLTIPIGTLTVAKATENVTLVGNFNATGTVASSAAQLALNEPLFNFDPTPASVTPLAAPPTGATLLTNLANDVNTPLFQVGDVIRMEATKGTRTLESKTFTVTATSTLQDFEAFMQGTLGINTTAGINHAAATPGITAIAAPVPNDTNALVIQIVGNLGATNDLAISATDITVERGATTLRPFSFTKQASSDGESVLTPATVYDSLGTAVDITVAAVLVARDTTGTSWEYFVESPDSTTGSGSAGGVGTNIAVGTGTLQFNNTGRLISTSTPPIVIDRSGTGAVSNLQFELSFQDITALAGTNSQLAATSQDGSSKGVLRSFAINDDGTLVGSFDNGVRRSLGQVALATFRNNQGLVDSGNNSFVPGSNSGLPVFSAPGQFSAGKIVSGALELSNVDLSSEFVNLISTTSAFTASSRVISTSNQLLQELLQSAR